MNNTPKPKLFKWTYRHTPGRRAHSHRCRCCWKVIAPGEVVIGLRLDAHKTWMLHNGCADRPHNPETTWLGAFEMWAGIREG